MVICADDCNFPELDVMRLWQRPCGFAHSAGSEEDEKGCRNCLSGHGHGPIRRASGPSPGLACRVSRAEVAASGAFGSSHAKSP
jgi:hypothetical protein